MYISNEGRPQGLTTDKKTKKIMVQISKKAIKAEGVSFEVVVEFRNEVKSILKNGFNFEDGVHIAISNSEVGQEISERRRLIKDIRGTLAMLSAQDRAFEDLRRYVAEEDINWANVYDSLRVLKRRSEPNALLGEAILNAHKLAFFYNEDNILRLADPRWVEEILAEMGE